MSAINSGDSINDSVSWFLSTMTNRDTRIYIDHWNIRSYCNNCEHLLLFSHSNAVAACLQKTRMLVSFLSQPGVFKCTTNPEILHLFFEKEKRKSYTYFSKKTIISSS